ncbi:MAG: SatD family protein [Acidobacteriota bacterium]
MTATDGQTTEPLYIAVIGDLVDSRSLPDRARVQRKLVETLERYNEKAEASIASRFLVTLGDEFQGLLRSSASVSDFWWFYQEQMHAVAPTRLGFGLGPLATDLLEEALGMDGPCFHAARSAIKGARAGKLQLAFGVASRREMTEILNRVSRPIERLSRGWSEVQWQTAAGLSRGWSQVEIAAERNVKRQSVNDVVRASLGMEVRDAWRGVDELIKFFARAWGQGSGPGRTGTGASS